MTPRERAALVIADALLSPARLAPRHRVPDRPARILGLRLERIGDLLMLLPALGLLRTIYPDSQIDLAVGSWNADVARSIGGVADVHELDVAWLARGAGLSLGGAIRAARRWRSHHYDLAINFEPDIRSNLILAASGAHVCVGYRDRGGGALLDVALDYDPARHTTDNAAWLVRRLSHSGVEAPPAALRISSTARQQARILLPAATGGPLIGMHVAAGRLVKQWPESRFAEVAQHLISARHATIILTGADSDRPQLDLVRRMLPPDAVVDAVGLPLMSLAAVFESLDLLVTVDTGPMHLADAVGTPIVAIFGPSDPARYAPRGLRDRVVRIDLPCAPCNRIRHPPARCTGKTPDCLTGVDAVPVIAAIDAVLAERPGPGMPA
jgi:ADP-heptose:LPS heptosyltransferase